MVPLTILITALTQDLGIYLGETFIRNHPSSKWGYVTKPKNITYVNKPSLSGFNYGGEDAMYDVLAAVYNLSMRYSQGKGDEKELSRSFKRWEKRLKIN